MTSSASTFHALGGRPGASTPDDSQPRSLFGTGGSLEPHATPGGMAGAVNALAAETGGSLNASGVGGSLGFSVQQSQQQPSPMRASSRNSPYVHTPAPRTPGGSISHQTEHGEFLADKLDYIVPPTINAVDREVTVSGVAVFMGHMRFETTPAEVRWLVRRLSGVTAVKVEPRSKGCFLVHLASEQDEPAVRKLHKRILMDHTGVWVARDDGEAQVLADYIEHVVNKGPKRRLRLPRDCVTVETPNQPPSSSTTAPQQSASSPSNAPPVPQVSSATATEARHSPFGSGSAAANRSSPHRQQQQNGRVSSGSMMPAATAPPPSYAPHQHQHHYMPAAPAPHQPFHPAAEQQFAVGGQHPLAGAPHHHHHQQQQLHPASFGRGNRPPPFASGGGPMPPPPSYVKSPVHAMHPPPYRPS